MKPEETLDHPIKVAWNRISRIYNTEAARHDSTMAVGFILLNIDQEKGTPSTKVGPLLGLEPRSLVRILASMEEKGLICRRNDPNDKRMIRIHLTDLGREKRKISKAAVIHLNKQIQKDIEPEKLSIFFEVMQQINDILEKKEIFDTQNYINQILTHEKDH